MRVRAVIGAWIAFAALLPASARAKQVAYEVWQAVKAHQPAPTPSYSAAERTRITVGVTPVAGAKNPLASVAIRRGDRVVKPATQSFDAGGGRFIFDFAAFAPTGDITIELAGRARTQSCLVADG